MGENDIAYYKRRLEEEESRAAGTECPATRCVHLKLARLYRKQIEKETQAGQEQLAVPEIEAVGHR